MACLCFVEWVTVATTVMGVLSEKNHVRTLGGFPWPFSSCKVGMLPALSPQVPRRTFRFRNAIVTTWDGIIFRISSFISLLDWGRRC